ncbi:MAG TPA: SPOR domain-containing protein [Methylotenera sp.]|nr:SPOR domain-containing protein [Methylotenera sp.]HPH05011.1 SPOR domain-containing protein [Methylotenera sp.]HPN00273.1 SPOR domain-containing protein [Methylotenera sp.]
MPPELQDDKALELKKRARRRLVGAIALVLLMIIILPMIIKDRAVPETPKEEILISMPNAETAVSGTEITQPSSSATIMPESVPVANQTLEVPVNPLPENVATPVEAVVVKAETAKPEEVKPIAQLSIDAKPTEVKQQEFKPEEVKQAEVKPVNAKSAETNPSTKGDFTIQIGVYSDPANVAQLQAKLKSAGFNSRTEKITTPKGEKIRLRLGKYSSRQEAADALTSLNSHGMTGMVITNK